jgi:hypothetical protein
VYSVNNNTPIYRKRSEILPLITGYVFVSIDRKTVRTYISYTVSSVLTQVVISATTTTTTKIGNTTDDVTTADVDEQIL